MKSSNRRWAKHRRTHHPKRHFHTRKHLQEDKSTTYRRDRIAPHPDDDLLHYNKVKVSISDKKKYIADRKELEEQFEIEYDNEDKALVLGIDPLEDPDFDNEMINNRYMVYMKAEETLKKDKAYHDYEEDVLFRKKAFDTSLRKLDRGEDYSLSEAFSERVEDKKYGDADKVSMKERFVMAPYMLKEGMRKKGRDWMYEAYGLFEDEKLAVEDKLKEQRGGNAWIEKALMETDRVMYDLDTIDTDMVVDRDIMYDPSIQVEVVPVTDCPSTLVNHSSVFLNGYLVLFMFILVIFTLLILSGVRL